MFDLKKQLSFYFSNQNFNKDTFLKKTHNTNKGIPISLLLTFKKLSENNVTEDNIKDLLVKNEDLQKIIKIEENKIVKLDLDTLEEYSKLDTDDLTVHIKGVKGNLDDVEEYLNKYFDSKLIRLRKTKNNEESGSCMVELASLEDVEKVIAMDIPAMTTTEKKNDEEKSDEEKNPKKLKEQKESMKITKKKDFLESRSLKSNKKGKPEVLSTKKRLQSFKGNFYYFKTDEKDVKTLKKNTGASFVDFDAKVMRFKTNKNYESEVFEGVTLTKMTGEDEDKYIENVVSKKN